MKLKWPALMQCYKKSPLGRASCLARERKVTGSILERHTARIAVTFLRIEK